MGHQAKIWCPQWVTRRKSGVRGGPAPEKILCGGGLKNENITPTPPPPTYPGSSIKILRIKYVIQPLFPLFLLLD